MCYFKHKSLLIKHKKNTQHTYRKPTYIYIHLHLRESKSNCVHINNIYDLNISCKCKCSHIKKSETT